MRRTSSEDDMEDEEDYNKYFFTRQQPEPKSNGIDCKYPLLTSQHIVSLIVLNSLYLLLEGIVLL